MNLDPKEIARNERPLQAILVEKLDKAVAQLEGELIGDPLVVAAMQDKFGASLLGLGESGKAIVLLAGYQNMKKQEAKIPPQGKVRLTEGVDRLVALFSATNKPDEVKKWQTERAKYPAVAPIPQKKK